MNEKQAYEQYDQIFNEEGSVVIGNQIFDRSRILRELDPISYKVGFNEWCDSEGIDTDDLK